MSRADLMYTSVARYLTDFQRYYPGILEWHSRLKNDLESGNRKMFVSWNGSDVKGLAITKNGHQAKLCHISVSSDARTRGLGSTLMQTALSDMVRCGAREIRVTTGEEVFGNHGPFFLAAGFEVIDWQVNRYRRGVSELVWKLEVDSDPNLLPFQTQVSHIAQGRIKSNSAELPSA